MSTALQRLPKEIRPLVLRAQDEGWELSFGRHPRLTKTGHSIVVIPTSPSDHRAWKNLRATLRREGVDV